VCFAFTAMSNDTLQRDLPHLLPRLWRFALRLARDAHDAEDLVQRTCVRALERRAQWQPGTALLSWLFAIEHSIWLNELRTPQRRRTGSLDIESLPVDDEPMASASGNPELQLHYRQVVTAVESLPQAQRVVMLLVAVEGLSYREAADILDVPIGTVMSRLSRARATVGQRFMDRSLPAVATADRPHTPAVVRAGSSGRGATP
jgi:RNA polymerase sigma-70 factor, ECF subfamily